MRRSVVIAFIMFGILCWEFPGRKPATNAYNGVEYILTVPVSPLQLPQSNGSERTSNTLIAIAGRRTAEERIIQKRVIVQRHVARIVFIEPTPHLPPLPELFAPPPRAPPLG